MMVAPVSTHGLMSDLSAEIGDASIRCGINMAVKTKTYLDVNTLRQRDKHAH